MADERIDSKPTGAGPSGDYGSLRPGTRIGRYEIVSVLGHGGFGITYLARDTQLDRDVAIKEYLPSALAVRHEDSTVVPRSTQMADDFVWGRARFLEEAKTMARFASAPAVVKVYEFIEAHGTAYVVMPRLEGETLEARLKREKRLQQPAIERILYPLLDGLEHVHAAGFLHRDIKPANIILAADGSPTLIDFGAARAAMHDRTQAMTAIFTPGYAPVEQFTSGRQGPWTDIYALAATLYACINGKPPPNALDRMMGEPLVPAAEIGKRRYAPSLLAGIDAGLILRAEDRPQTIDQWRGVLATGALLPDNDATRRIAPSPAVRQATVAARQRPIALWLALAAVVLAVAGSAGYWTFLREAPQTSAAVAANLRRALAEAEKKAAQEESLGEEAANKRKLEAQRTAAEQATRDRLADEARRKAELDALNRQQEAERQKIERDRAEATAREKAESEARLKELDQARKAAEEERAKAQAASKEAAEQDARKKAADDEKAKADALARSADDLRRAGERDETALRLGDKDRQKIQVALTSLGFATGTPDGSLGPRSRQMIGAPATGFVSAAQRDQLFQSASASIARWEDELKKTEESKKKAEEEAKLKAEAEAKAQAAAPSAAPPGMTAPAASPPAVAPTNPSTPTAPSGGTFDGTYQGTLLVVNFSRPMALRVTNGSGFGATVNPECGLITISIDVSPAGDISGLYNGYGSGCDKRVYAVKGRASARQLDLTLSGTVAGSTGYGKLTRQ